MVEEKNKNQCIHMNVMERIYAACGACCSDCVIFQKECAGCTALKGIVPWMEYVHEPVCPIYDCCVNNNGFKHCGECKDLACKKFYQYRDPELSDKENDVLNERRINICRSLVK